MKKRLILLMMATTLLTACGQPNSWDEEKHSQVTEENTTSEVESQLTEEVTELMEPIEIETETKTETESESTSESQPTEIIEKERDWVSDLSVAKETNQIIIVAASGSSATVTMHNKYSDGNWEQIFSTPASIGRNGIGKTSEGDGKTPKGRYAFSFAFGIKSNPGTALSYTQVDDSYYWVDDSNSQYYNRFVTTNEVEKDWSSAEHIMGAGQSYNYVLAINYNEACIPGAGSAIFMHCKPTGGAGCIAVSESAMKTILQNVKPGCVLIIDSVSGVYNY